MNMHEKHRDPRDNGDWLAVQLRGKFQADGGGVDISAFIECLKENGIEIDGKWAALPESNQHGWEGRFCMIGRIKLRNRVCENRLLIIDGKKLKPSPADVDAMRDAS